MDAGQIIAQIVDKKMIPGIFLKYRIKNIIKFWRKRSKNSKQRFYKLKEWSYTQHSYLQKLVILRDQVKLPLRANNMIDQIQQTMIFPNLESMIQLGEQMKMKIDQIISQWNPIKTCLAPTVESLVVYLKIYKQYSNNFQRADKLIQELKKDPKYKQVIKIFNVEDYLIKPVQRPLQYKLFLTDYLKLLPKNHIDRERLQKSLKTLLKIADQINQFVDKQLRAEKMIKLENTFGNLIESTREYRCMIEAIHPEFNCRIYVFNDLLLITKVVSHDKQEKLCYLYLCGASYVIRQPDNVNFKNRLYICGSFQSIHLTFKSFEDANHAYSIIDSLISILYQKQAHRQGLMTQIKQKRETLMVMNRNSMSTEYKWKQQYEYRMKLKVEVIGVEKRLYQKQWKIVYFVKIRLGVPEELHQIIAYQIDELKDIEKYIREVYKNISIPSLQTRYRAMSLEDVRIDFTKYYEYKSIIIQDFLNSCLRCKQICKKPEYIIFKLKLHQTIWDYLNRFSTDCACEACLNSTVVNMSSYINQRQFIKAGKYPFCNVNTFELQKKLPDTVKPQDFKSLTLEQRLIWVTCKQNKIDYGLQNRGHFGKKLGFHVSIKLIGQQSDVYIDGATVNDTCRQIVQEICARKNIIESQDFCLVYVHGKYQYYLDNDEYVYDAIKHVQEGYKKMQNDKKANVSGRGTIFGAFSKSMDGNTQIFSDYSVVDEPKLFLRKYIYLSQGLEQYTCLKNPQRYPVILGQLLRKFQQQILLLSIEQVKQFCALFYGIEQFNTIIFSKKIFCNEQKIKRYLPQVKWNIICTEFMQRIRQIIQSQVKTCPNILLVYQTVLKRYGDKIGWITQYFSADNKYPQSLSTKQKSLLIGVNYNKVLVCRRFNTGSLLQFPISKFQYRTSGDVLFIDSDVKTYQFVGNSSWVLFENLVEKYRLLQEMEPK